MQLMSVFDNWFYCLLSAAESIYSQIQMQTDSILKKKSHTYTHIHNTC